jgi:predicted ATPase
VTSREALGVEGEHVHLLYSLDCPPEDAGLTATEALRYPAAQLFMERGGGERLWRRVERYRCADHRPDLPQA